MGGGGLVGDGDITTNFGPGLAIQTLPDADHDGVADAHDNCPSTANAGQEDGDRDGAGDACDDCPGDANKVAPGACGCGQADRDSDRDGLLDCDDPTPNGNRPPPPPNTQPLSEPGPPEIVVPPGCGAGVGLANLAAFWTLCLLGLVSLRKGRP